MPTPPSIPTNAPFDADQRAWLNGWLAGLFFEQASETSTESSLPEEAIQLDPLLILYGSQSGTAEGIARDLATQAGGHGFEPRVAEANDYEAVAFASARNVLIITSTWGEGDPPDNAADFWNYLSGDSGPDLKSMRYAVLALGDSSYEDFCGAGRNIDERLAELGAERFHARTDCDVDYEQAAGAWAKGVWGKIGRSGEAKPADSDLARDRARTGGFSGLGEDSPDAAAGSRGQLTPPTVAGGYSRNAPYPSHLLVNRRLNRNGSAKDTRHFELSLIDSGLNYEVGDALGVQPTNCPGLVDEMVTTLGLTGEESVLSPDRQEKSLRQALIEDYAITLPSLPFLESIAEKSGDSHLQTLLQEENREDRANWLWGREIIDLLVMFPKAAFEPAEFVGLLKKLNPRLYSIASSPKAHPGEVHLTVAAVRYESHGRQRKGVCSTALADRVRIKETPVPVFIQKSNGFRLPKDPSAPVIMVGPGTGIAPFRAFLEERHATQAPGKNWLFFGDQRRQFDFLYEEELDGMQKQGVLNRLDTAFSRDQADKVYVQDRMTSQARELWGWLEEGAHFYVCGDAKRMAHDVDQALHGVIQQGGQRSDNQAREYVHALKKARRYQRDVY